MKQYAFTREDTKMMKGFAIILMLMHHLWAFPDRLITDLPLTFLTAYGIEIKKYIGWYGKICVSLFMFLSGYGSYLLYEQKRLNYLEKLKHLYISYWKVFAIFIPVGFLLFHEQTDYCSDIMVCHVFSHYNLQEFLANLAGTGTSYNREWWLFFSYVIILITFPIIAKIIQKNTFGVNFWIVCIYEILTMYIFPTLRSDNYFPILGESQIYNTLICQVAPWSASYWCGCIFAKDNMLEQLQQNLNKAGLLTSFTSGIVIIGTFFFRSYVAGEEFDIFYVPVLCLYGTYLFKKVLIIKKCLIKLGTQSTNMWLIHSFLIYYFYEAARIILSVRNAYLVLLIFIASTYALSCGVDKFYYWINKLYINMARKE